MLRSLLCGLLLYAAAAPAAAQAPVRDPLLSEWEAASDAWDLGRYDTALARLERLLLAPGAERFRDSVALLTGELFPATALADTATKAYWSPDGTLLAVEGAGRTELWRVAEDSLMRLAPVPASGASFVGRSHRIAYLAAAPLGREVRVRDLDTGGETVWGAAESSWFALAPGGTDDRLVVLRGDGRPQPLRVEFLLLGADGRVRSLVEGPGIRTALGWGRNGTLFVFTGAARLQVLDLATGETLTFPALHPSLGNDSQVVYVGRAERENALSLLTLGQQAPTVLKRTTRQLASPALSPGGGRVAFQMALRDDWELFTVGTDGTGERRLTHEIQDDVLPVFLTDDRLMVKEGEQRHRRSALLDLGTLTRTRLFANNTVRTVASEYAWVPSPDGRRIVVLAHRDGNTLERPWGAWLLDTGRRVGSAELLARVRTQLAAERNLRERGRRMFAPIATAVRAAVGEVRTGRIWRTARDLQEFESRGTRMPGNARTIAYLEAKLREYGYEPEVQWFEARGLRTANVVARLRGTVSPEKVVVLSAHFDSADEGPGAEDNGSGTTGVLEVARVLAGRPQPATVLFALVGAEEIGMFGSRELVRRMQAESLRVAAALNNDTHGWSHDHRLDLIVRYSNPGIRDVQHAAAIGFTDLITYDGVRFQSSDGASFWRGFGDVVGGLGSYPGLASPHYHEPHDLLETINHQLVAEAAKATVASVMLLAASPMPLTGLRVERTEAAVVATWDAAREPDAKSYRVAFGPPEQPARRTLLVRAPRAVLAGAQPGWQVAVRAVTARGLEGWGAAQGVVP